MIEKQLSLNFMIIDSCPFNVEIIKKIIDKKYKNIERKIKVFHQRDEALEEIKLNRFLPHVILIDLDNSQLKTLDLAYQIKEWTNSHNYSVPILLTTSTYKPVPAYFMEYIDAIIIKPFILRQVAYKIDQEIAHHLKINELLKEFPILNYYGLQA